MTQTAPPTVRFVDDCFVVELGPDYSHLQENILECLTILPLLAESVVPARLLLDMGEVKFIGSALIGHLITTSKRLSARNGSFALINLNKFCQTVIDLSGLNSMLPTYDSKQAAIEETASDSADWRRLPR